MRYRSGMTHEEPPWAKPLPPDETIARWAATLEWHDYLAALTAVEAHRDDMRREREARQHEQAFLDVFCYVSRMGLLPFCVEYLRTLYGAWRYGILPEDL